MRRSSREKGSGPRYDVDYVISTFMSFRRAKVVMAANEFDLFTHLSGKALTAIELADLLGADSRALGLLLDALVSIHLLTKDGATYSNTPTVEECLVKGQPGYIGDMIKHMNDGWSTWGELERPIFGDKPKVKDWKERFILALDNLAGDKAHALAERVDLSEKKKLLDVGGGSGAYSVAFIERYPRLRAVVLDTPETLRVTKKLLAKRELGGRVETLEGDFDVEELGRGYDAVLVSNIIHFQNVDENLKLLVKGHRALNVGGVIIIHDYILDDDKTGPPGASMFALHMLLNSDEGRTYSWREIEEWLATAGFSDFERIELGDSRAVLARKKE
ncbi:MAG: methyltransferase [Candidatus Hydrothermarchaeaceae archaeon]